jgi:hypothetical protein
MNNSKIHFKTFSQLVLSSVVLLPGLAQAAVTQDAKKKMTELLGHVPEVMNVLEAQKQKLDSGAPRFQPWSGSFWPDINGGITNHYRDNGKLGSQLNFVLRYDRAKHRLRNDHKQVCEKYPSWNVETLNQKLSPAEKYDLLLGNTNFEFTKAVMDEIDFRADYRITTKKSDGTDSDSDINEGSDNNYFYEDDTDNKTYARFDDKVQYRYWRKKGGSLAYWSGICDGWAPASVYLPRPEKPVTVTGALGHQITFYPDDIKALGSYLFARTNTPYYATMNYKFAGRKCDESGSPATDKAGWVKDIRCNDLDAGIWHLSLINRIGRDRMGFVFDVDNNLKINNHPIGGYELKYFNPATGKEGTLKDSIVPRGAVQDRYAKRRKAEAVYLLGVKSKIKMVYYVWPEGNRKESYDHEGRDEVKTVEYSYDLELDANYNIVGGEWGERFAESAVIANPDENEDSETPVETAAKQPDFIWMAGTKALPQSEMAPYAYKGAKKDLEQPRPFGNVQWAWDGKSILPEDWLRAARADMNWYAPVPVNHKDELDTKPEAKNSILKSAQPLSHIVYFLFDQSRSTMSK